jgi:proteasome lid subunit RPN8/RPN11
MSLHITHIVLNRIWEHARESYPEEGAGILLGTVQDDGRHVVQILPVQNQFEEHSRHNRYRIDPREMLRAEREAERLDLDVFGVFHSHPDHPARPSEFDREWALPWYSYLITSVTAGEECESRSWRLSEDRARFDEEPLHITKKESIAKS